jgi:DedD protein
VTELTDDHGEDGFHEIQLSGKQLVFLFMATTVVSVVIFLCGVLVGRGVRGDTVSAADPTVAAAGPVPAAPAPPVDPPPAPAPETSDVAKGPSLEYPKRLNDDRPVAETLKPAESRPTAAAAKPAAADAPAPAPAPAAATPGAPGPQAGTWAVQVVALSDRSAATAVVQRLSGKGYPAFIVTPQPGAAVQNYKVQVGRYSDRNEAEQMKQRLKKEEQFEPFILR